MTSIQYVPRGLTWFKAPAGPTAPKLTAGRLPLAANASVVGRSIEEGNFRAAQDKIREMLNMTPETVAEMADLVLNRPTSSLNHRTTRFAGKAYHWRQDYTGQLKLAAGDSPW